jgi:chaperonin GroEL
MRLYRERASEFGLLADAEASPNVQSRYRIVARHYRELADREEQADEARMAERIERARLQRATESEIKERKATVDKALYVTRAALEEGIVPGGGVALLRAVAALNRVRTQNDSQKTGVDIVRKAITWPARQIAINAGEDGSVVVDKILEKKQYDYGFDAQKGEYCNLKAEGIIDPTKVVRVALQQAPSISGLLITAEAIMAKSPLGMPSG